MAQKAINPQDSMFTDGSGSPLLGKAQDAIPSITDNTGATASDTIADTVGVDVADVGPAQVVLVSEFEAAVATLAAKVNSILDVPAAHGLIKV